MEWQLLVSILALCPQSGAEQVLLEAKNRLATTITAPRILAFADSAMGNASADAGLSDVQSRLV
ncbi:hypothetical protein [Thiothrix fructosivorans]|uniref:Uncharacterized protein n=1 Tax=Thiothrix fructosivorans TaxID=111770 RepID=A0A8B0SJC1_9GAMM|nr:hypothetical protein [Thiothrix fructosivorans]MBO0612194.1 hypothetical protein [Thiothrix fructosivorans]QTX12313.1 hypothetical protein J1836_008315 [Thiothrix fructosivorans]